MVTVPTRLRLRLVEGDLTELITDAIVNPANSYGEMGGGVAGAIRKKGGVEIEREAMAKAPIPIGKAVQTRAGSLPCRSVIHAPTMARPAEVTGIEQVKKATRAALECADESGLKQIAFPGMGTGVGRVDPEAAAQAMVEVSRSFRPKSLQEVVFVSLGEDLKQAFKKALRSNASDA
jgi:O-acetyl-ADP-ribose deacetylase (regulator of RNase III)